ncbi:MAG: hypothetical protein IPK72_24485 [Candidatus Eisenbacteria bacterium]|nr:hypothetical protein [Candidatus Eisenbacteria bacterium]
MNFDQLAESCRSRIVPGPRIAVLGSTAFYGALSESICQILAADLAGTPEIVLLTGGVSGVGQTFGHAFFEARRSQQLPPNVYHLLPAEMAPVEYGVTLPAGDSLSDRREVLGRVANLYIIIEGGPGTVHESATALDHGLPVVPIAATGGHALELYATTDRPPAAKPDDWSALAMDHLPPASISAAAARVVRALLR